MQFTHPALFSRARFHALGTVALAASIATAPGHAAVIFDGSYFSQASYNAPDLLDWYISNGVDNPPQGSLTLNAGSTFSMGGLALAWNKGNATALVDGVGSTLNLVAPYTAALTVGSWGQAVMTVSNGGQVLGDINAGLCAGRCAGSIASFAGSSGTLVVTGAGSTVSLRDTLSLATGQVVDDGAAGLFGTPGGASSATLQVLNGATLRSSRAETGVYNNNGFLGNGLEQRSAVIQVKGPGSTWTLGGTSDPIFGFSSMVLSGSAGSTTQLEIADGGKVRLTKQSSFGAWVYLGDQGGTATARITGAGSALEWVAGTAGSLALGKDGSSSFLDVLAGGQVTGLVSLGVGGTNGLGVLNVSGADSKVLLNGHAAGGGFSGISIGASGAGRMTVSQGAQVELARAVGGQFGLALNVGSGATGQGLLTVTGADSVLRLAQASVVPGGGVDEVQNPNVAFGRDGVATVLISGGGKLLVEGNAVSTAAAIRNTVVNIGGGGGAPLGGMASVVVTGAGSELRMTGSDRFMTVGRGTGSTGRLTVNAGGLVTGTLLQVGRQGTGQLSLDGGTVRLDGQYTGSAASASLGVGLQGGTGTVELKNGAQLRIDSQGTASMGVNLGGSGSLPGGNGALSLTGGSSVLVRGPAGLPITTVGYDGTATLRVSGASTYDIADGNLFVGRAAAGVGTAILEGGSSLTAGWVGVGRSRTVGSADLSGTNGGVGTLIVNDSTLTAQNIVIGNRGYLGGSGTLVGNVVNFGTFNPGNSPGTMLIDGSFAAGAGGRLVLEVEADGNGGFNTDKVLFRTGSGVDLGALTVQFTFLGNTDPNAFQASGSFQIDNFLGYQAADGKVTSLGAASYAGVQFTAQAEQYEFSYFSYTPAGGAVFSATPVPEPAQWALLLAGGWLVASVVRRKRALA